MEDIILGFGLVVLVAAIGWSTLFKKKDILITVYIKLPDNNGHLHRLEVSSIDYDVYLKSSEEKQTAALEKIQSEQEALHRFYECNPGLMIIPIKS